jgi:DNA-binding NarL/FixJ family response regulator
MPLRILIVDDHRLFAESLRLALRASGFEAASVDRPTAESVAAAVEAVRPDVVLLDLDLGSLSGNDLVPAAVALGARVVISTGVQDRLRLAACVEAGVHAIVYKVEPLPKLVDWISRAAQGEQLLPNGVREQLLAEQRVSRAAEARRRQLFEQLTPREGEVLAALASGRKVAEIARDSYVSVATVRAQVNAILRKLGVNSQLEAVALAHAHHWWPGETCQAPVVSAV